MSYFIFQKNFDNFPGTLYRIAENDNDLNLLNINKNDYKIIEDNIDNFNAVKYRLKIVEKYNNNNITFVDNRNSFATEKDLSEHINNTKMFIKIFLNQNKNHPQFNIWNNYYDQLNNLNTSNITYPLNKSLEQYFNDLGQPSLNILQIP